MKLITTGQGPVYVVEGDSTVDSVIETGAQVISRLAKPGMMTTANLAQLVPLTRTSFRPTASEPAKKAGMMMAQMSRTMLAAISSQVALLERQPTIYQTVSWSGGYNTLTPVLQWKTPYDGQWWRVVGIHASREVAVDWGMTQLVVGGLNHIITNQTPASPVVATADISVFEPAGRRDGMVFPIAGNLLHPDATLSLQFRCHNPLAVFSELHCQLLVQASPCGKGYEPNKVYQLASNVGWILSQRRYGNPMAQYRR